ncbi:unnamed protein product [Lathyrus sativus]|nr:unnamed protein product [Lathyrus sativus]
MSENTQPRKRLIIKLKYLPGSRKHDSDSCGRDENKRRKIEDSVKPIVTCYWIDSNYRTKSSALSQPKNNDNVVEDKKMIKNQVPKTTALSQPEDNDNVVEDKKTIKNKVFKTRALSQPKDNDKKVIKNQVSNTIMPNNIVVENKNQVSKTEIAFNGRKESSRGEPMECVKRRQCWLILNRMMVDRDGWDLKDPPKIAMIDKSESKSKAIGLKDIERKLRLYATPDEFSSDIRLVFSNAMLMYPPRNHIYRIAKKFSENFEHKWKSLKDTWKLEDRKRSKTHKSTRY